ncbi:polysaccharide deacetylase family protein [Streptacidiphilus melanogenes]|uniref:polysaccharide deacetylase family protein n=1 Tax=Streptacidiphilus melanogenes TaxID=411235 RepID=UPI000694F970|nr:polysaccharide deacetylase family protein [Streptacidiphilus melanogenes]
MTDVSTASSVSRRVLLSLGGLTLISAFAPPAAAAASPGAAKAPAAARPPSPMRPGEMRPGQVLGDSHPVGVTTPHETGLNRHRPQYYVHKGSHAIALTIDDGPHPRYTPQVLALLQRYGITATFCQIGDEIGRHPALVREVADQGHLIANHTWTHPDLVRETRTAVREEIVRTSEILERTTGRTPDLFRAPYGAWSSRVLAECRTQGLRPLDWSVDPRDWSRPGVSSIVRTILRTTRTGSIILEHDGGGDRSQTVAALRTVLPRLLDEGYHFVTP